MPTLIHETRHLSRQSTLAWPVAMVFGCGFFCGVGFFCRMGGTPKSWYILFYTISPVPSVPPALFMEVDFFSLSHLFLSFSFYLIFFNRNGGIHPRITKQFRPELAQKVTDLTCARPRFFLFYFRICRIRATASAVERSHFQIWKPPTRQRRGAQHVMALWRPALCMHG